MTTSIGGLFGFRFRNEGVTTGGGAGGGGAWPSVAIFAAGRTTFAAANEIATTEKYDLDLGTVVFGTSLSLARNILAGCGNSEQGYFGGGVVGAGSFKTTIDTYTYADDTIASSLALSVARSNLMACSVLEASLFAGGLAGGASLTTTDKITHATGTIAAATVLNTGRSNGAGVASPVLGYISSGNSLSSYQFADDTAAVVSAVLAGSRIGNAATGSLTTGYFGSGGTGAAWFDNVDKLNFAAETISAGTALGGTKVWFPAAAGNGDIGLWAGGGDSTSTMVAQVRQYTYGTDVVAAGHALTTARWALAAASSQPGNQ